MEPLYQNSENRAFNIHLIVSNICRYTKIQDLPAMRLVNRVTNYSVLMNMKKSKSFPTVLLVNNDDVNKFLDVMATRAHRFPTFYGFSLALDAPSLEKLQEFVEKTTQEVIDFEFAESVCQTTWELTPPAETFNEHEPIAPFEFTSKIMTILKAKSTQLQKVVIKVKHDIPLDPAEVYLGQFENLRELHLHYLTDELQMQNDLATFIIAKSPNLEKLEVTNFFGMGRWHYSPELIHRLGQVLNRPNPPFLNLRTQVTLDDVVAFETFMHNNYNRLRYLEFLLIFDTEIPNGLELLDRFSTSLEYQSPALEELSVLASGHAIVDPLRLPILTNLKILEIASCTNLHMTAIHPLVPNQFPSLTTLEISGHNLFKDLLGETVIPSVKYLLLDLEDYQGQRPATETVAADTIHINFPNLTALELRDKSYLNLKQVDYVLTHLFNLEVLVLTTHLTLKNKRGNVFWKTFAGKEQRVSKQSILDRIVIRTNESGDDTTTAVGQELSEGVIPSLANLKKLKVFEITVTLTQQLAALAFMARRGSGMKPLEEMYVAFTCENRINEKDKLDFFRVLTYYHKQVKFRKLDPPKELRI